ncbi:keratin, type I microfibrillar, 47.6 kDa-like isoform X2 [Hylaeus volcanicus]|uniref:keratin, type I microfibrillar, 47.6 kDa-like isoform X2 n=1 Tax=Hylaeus volcanicus TaxID=313075 RepID=UPI0023B86FE3|nr:keratin, type I microfibrillar, 47.6 kDa-like isoform X2 [Hylaeus volcanicus]
MFESSVNSWRKKGDTSESHLSSTNMNYFALCFLAAICVVQVMAYNNPLEQLRQQLEKSKSNVNSIVSDIKRTRNSLSSSTSSQLSTIRGNSMSTVNKNIDSAINEIRATVDAAKAEGKDVEQCYITGRDSLNAIKQTALSELQKCEQDAQQQLRQALQPLDAAENTGNQYLNELNMVFLNCYSSNIMQMQSCIAIKLGTINASIRTYENTVNSLKREAQRAANQAYLSAFSCNNSVVTNIFSGISGAKIAVNRCVKS